MAKIVLLKEFEQLIFPKTKILAVDGKATAEQAIAATDDETFMTPLQVLNSINAHSGGGGGGIIIYEYSPNGVSDWSRTLRDTDKWYRISADNGENFGPAMLINSGDGVNGATTMYYYTLSAYLTIPRWNATDDATGTLGNWWTLTVPDPVQGLCIWMTFRMYRDGVPLADSVWSQPFVMQGQPGLDGEDGLGYEYCYKSQPKNISQPGVYHKPGEDLQADDYLPFTDSAFTVRWTDNPVGCDLENDVEYVIQRKKSNGTWGAFSGVSIWATFALDGLDGQGYEYCFCMGNKVDGPPGVYDRPGDDTTRDDYCPFADQELTIRYTDDPQGTDPINDVEYAIMRKKVNGVWLDFCIPYVYSMYGQDGRDGISYEQCFSNRTRTMAAPGIYHKPGEDQLADDYLPYVNPEFTVKWTDDPTGVTPAKDIEYSITRRKVDGVWLPFCSPGIWAVYSKDGNDGRPGNDGLPGELGDKGPMVLFYGLYNSTFEYTVSEDARLIVYKESSGIKTYYLTLLVSEGGIPGSFTGSDPATDTRRWKRFNGNFMSVATEVLFAEYANIGGWILKGNKLISQKGTINGVESNDYMNSLFVPNIVLDGISGTADLTHANVAGNINSKDIYIEGKYRRRTSFVEADRNLGGVVIDGVVTHLPDGNLELTYNDTFIYLRRDCYGLVNYVSVVEPLDDQSLALDGTHIKLFIENSGTQTFTVNMRAVSTEGIGKIYPINYLSALQDIPSLKILIIELKYIHRKHKYPTSGVSGWYVVDSKIF